MRYLVLAAPLLFIVPKVISAETFNVTAVPDSVTVYDQAAEVTRRFSLDLDVGEHLVVLSDLPESASYAAPKIAVEGARLGPFTVREAPNNPFAVDGDPRIAAAQDDLRSAQEALAVFDDEMQSLRLRAQSADARLNFLSTLGKQDDPIGDLAAYRDMIALIDETVLLAGEQKIAAEKDVRLRKAEREKLEKSVIRAQAVLDGLSTEDRIKTELRLPVAVESNGEVEFTVSYFVGAQWAPHYSVSLTEAPTPTITFDRGAYVSQESGENWEDVSLTLSTIGITHLLRPVYLSSKTRTLRPEPKPELVRTSSGLQKGRIVVEAPVIVEEMASANFEGPGVTYRVPGRLTVMNEGDQTFVQLDQLRFDAEIFAQAVPRFDETAYRMVRFTNTTREPILSSEESFFAIDGTVIGSDNVEQIPAGSKAVLGFGAIEALRLEYVILDASEGDRGVLTRSNEQREATRLTIENLGDRNWPVEVLDQVPVSRHDDLEITSSFDPKPTEEHVDDTRGVMAWRFDLEPSREHSIEVEHSLRWPEGMILR